ncbi:DUF3667 domain-containing protein [Acetobacteroides hydrogenigenes]|uniref:Uncharacterized protein DUF3667 n=1 Tax=Acetobacteroides hydrogenigenes TaxID=979970 RepID=A0A4R2E2C5_9BACT|nr:DUF3667 domain-containing protein [Acetobacteroides hydrogenigenes]TCN61673.1 uncharacterized protein DUF3667 [Acetobacteroides hydrogenigenes]
MLFRFFKYHFTKRKRSYRYVATPPPYSHCKNCGKELHGKYCAACGQQAIITNQPLRESIATYFDTYYALDRRVGFTLYFLFFRPGFLTREFMQGRIERYVHPFKLYFFSSILFFSIALGLSDSEKKDEPAASKVKKEQTDKGVADTRSNGKATKQLLVNNDEKKEVKVKLDTDGDTEKETAFERAITKIAEKKFKDKSPEEVEQMVMSNFSLSMLLLMPIFAVLLKLMYLRRRHREHRYLSHLIHAVHLHSFTFIAVSIGILWDALVKSPQITGWIIFGSYVYLVVSLAKFYHQGYFKGFIKSLFLLFFYSIINIIAIVLVAVFTIFI